MLANASVVNTLDSHGRRNRLTTTLDGVQLSDVEYQFTAESRLNAVIENQARVTFGYEPKSSLVGSKMFSFSGEVAASTRMLYDQFNRLQTVSTRAGGSVVSGRQYEYDNQSRRTRSHLPDGRQWQYIYNARDEIITATKHFPATSENQSGRNFAYSYDNIGNRLTADSGGDCLGGSMRTTTYTADDLNQYNSITNHRYYEIVGTDPNPASVSVTAASGTEASNENLPSTAPIYFRREIKRSGTGGGLDSVTVTSSGGPLGATINITIYWNEEVCWGKNSNK